MRVEQQTNANIIDNLKQSIGPEEKESGISFLEKAVEKSTKTCSSKSVNLKDATYMKPGAEENKTVVDEMEQSAALDAEERKNQMAVLANTTSPEDYAKMQEDGFSLDSTTTNTIVTETDKIKAELAKAGVDISFFGDDLSVDQLEAIAGSPELARQLVETMKKADLPVTEENVKETVEALQMADKIGHLEDGAIKYMLDNQLDPTIENLYKAEYCGSSNYQGANQESVDISSFTSQVEDVIRQAGLQVNSQTMSDSKWLLENEVPLTPENLQYLQDLKQETFSMGDTAVMDYIAMAVSEGKRPKDAVMVEGYDLSSQAQHTMEVVTETTDADLEYVIDHGMDVNIRNLEYAIHQRKDTETTTGQTAETTTSETTISEAAKESAGQEKETYTQKGLALLSAKRQLEEIRLVMTAEANYALLKKGISIDTQPLEQLVEELKEQENSYYANLLESQGIDASEENVSLFKETTEKVTDMKSVPAYVLGMRDTDISTINGVQKEGSNLRDVLAQANLRYETLMTAPRADLGDSIQKAFQNVDDILQDLGLDTTEENQRAVRILGYNGLDITEESVAQMKAADEEVQRVFKNMTPAVVTQMIKKNLNPLDMDFETLNSIAEEINQENVDAESEKFAEYLWKLEKNDAITEDERKSYIGIYRLIHQVEQTDGAAVGALVNQGAEITMRNLMTAVRSSKKDGKMDYKVDESFGESKSTAEQDSSITNQVEAAYQNNCLKDVADIMTPEKIRTVLSQTVDWENMTPEQFKAALEQSSSNEVEVDYAYAKEQLEGLTQSANASQDIYQVLQKYDIPNTMANVIAMESMMKNRNQMFRQIFGKNVKASDEKVGQVDLEEIKEGLLEEFGEAVKSPKELGEVQEKLGNLAENVMKTMIDSDDVTSIDVREMRMISKQLSIQNKMAENEEYSVPVQVGDGVVNVSLKIVRGVDKKGTVDIAMESELRGKIAATFQAKEEGIHGLVVTDNLETKELLSENASKLIGQIDEESSLNVAYMDDLNLNQFSNGVSEEERTAGEGGETYQVQTTRLYHIAESFIRSMQNLL